MSAPKNNNSQKGAEMVREAANKDIAEVLQMLGTTATGLTAATVAEKMAQYGPNEVAQEQKNSWLHRLYIASVNPLVILLSVLAIITFATAQSSSDYISGSVMLLMVVLGLSLRFIQETKADNAAAKLKAMIKVTATVLRDGQAQEIPLKELVPGDVVKLSAGDMIPGDARLMVSKDLFIIQATLTGESLPVEKTDARDPRTNVSSIEHTNICFPWHQRGEWFGHGGYRGHGHPDLFRQNGFQPRRSIGGDRV